MIAPRGGRLLQEARTLRRQRPHELVCPAADCRSGYRFKQTEPTEALIARVPEAIRMRYPEGEWRWYRCTYCGGGWVQSGGVKKLLGWWDDGTGDWMPAPPAATRGR